MEREPLDEKWYHFQIQGIDQPEYDFECLDEFTAQEAMLDSTADIFEVIESVSEHVLEADPDHTPFLVLRVPIEVEIVEDWEDEP